MDPVAVMRESLLVVGAELRDLQLGVQEYLEHLMLVHGGYDVHWGELDLGAPLGGEH